MCVSAQILLGSSSADATTSHQVSEKSSSIIQTGAAVILLPPGQQVALCNLDDDLRPDVNVPEMKAKKKLSGSKLLRARSGVTAYCCVTDCDSHRRRKLDPQLSFHRSPSGPLRRRAWLQHIQTVEEDVDPYFQVVTVEQ